MPIHRIFQYSLVACIFYLVLSVSWNYSSNPTIDPLLLVSVIGYLCLLIYLLSLRNHGAMSGIIMMIVFASILWVALRAVYLVGNIDSLNYQYLIDTGSSGLIYTMLMISVLTIALVAGLNIGFRSSQLHKIRKHTTSPRHSSHVIQSYNFFALYFLFTLLLSLVIRWLGAAAGGGVWIYGVINMVASAELGLLMFLYMIVTRWNSLFSAQKGLTVVLLILYVVVRMLAGSKGGMFQVVSTAFVAIAVIDGRHLIPKGLLVLGSILLPVSILLFFLGFGIRGLLAASVGGEVSVSYMLNNIEQVMSLGTSFLELNGGAMETISKRVSMLDYLHVMFNLQPTFDYISPTYQLKVIANVVAPGTLFPDATLFSALLFKSAYGYQTYTEVLSNYHSDMIPMFGWLYVNAGGFSIPLTFAVGVLFGFIYRRLSELDSSWAWSYKLIAMYIFFNFLFGMGLDAVTQTLLLFIGLPYVVARVAHDVLSNLGASIKLSLRHAKTQPANS